jgi:hypothetical protein
MMAILHVVIVCSILIWASIISAQPNLLPEALLDPQFLRSCTWKVDKRIQEIVSNWQGYTEKQEFVDKTVLNKVQVTVLGITFTAEYRVFITDSLAEIVLFSGSDYGEDFCPAFLGWATKHLGKPDKIIDRSSLGRDSSFNDVTADWLLGQSRVQLGCSGTNIHGKFIPIIASLVYSHKDRLKALEDLIYIECSLTTKYVGSLSARKMEEGPPLTLIIDSNRRELLKRNKLLFLKTTKYTDEEILASTEDEKGKQDFRLDRVTGNYEWIIRLKPNSRDGADCWGKCLRVDPGRRF